MKVKPEISLKNSHDDSGETKLIPPKTCSEWEVHPTNELIHILRGDVKIFGLLINGCYRQLPIDRSMCEIRALMPHRIFNESDEITAEINCYYDY